MTEEELQKIQAMIETVVTRVLVPLATRLDQLEQGQKQLATKQDTQGIEVHLSRVEAKLLDIERVVTHYQDLELRQLSRRVKRLEEHLHILPAE